MANDASNVRVAVSGKVWAGAYSATAPTGTGSDPSQGAAHADLGYVDESGVVLSLPGEGDKTPLRAWQNGEVVRTLRTPSEEAPTFAVNFIETKLEVVEFVLGVQVTQTGIEGQFDYKVTSRVANSFIVDVIDGSELMRFYAPNGVVTALNDIELISTDMIKFGCTVAADLDSGAGYNFRSWMTSLRS